MGIVTKVRLAGHGEIFAFRNYNDALKVDDGQTAIDVYVPSQDAFEAGLKDVYGRDGVMTAEQAEEAKNATAESKYEDDPTVVKQRLYYLAVNGFSP